MDHIKLRSRFALVLAVLIAPFAGVSAAGLIDSSTNLNNARTTANVDVNVNTSSNASSTRRATTTDIDSASHDNGSATVTTGTQGGVDVQAGNSGVTIHIDRSSDDVQSTLGANVSTDAVVTTSDLKAFAAAQVRNDTNFNSVDITDDHINVGYRQPARFLGIIPMNMSVTVTVGQDGTVNVSYPWYSFLTLTNRQDLEIALQDEVQAYNAGQATLATPQAKASLVARIVAVLKAHLTSSSGNASSTQIQSNS